jgi:hypothetical protein
MKKSSISILFILFILSIINAQSPSDDSRAINMLRCFYVSYDSAWISIDNHNALKNQLLFLQQNYCSDSLQGVVNEYYNKFGLDHDLFLDDAMPDMATFVATLTVIKDTTRVNSYIVSFTYNVNNPGETGQRQIALRVGVVNVNNSLKINSVESYQN